jgi:hypothetical protein
MSSNKKVNYKAQAVQVVVYDMAGNTLPPSLQKEIDLAVSAIVNKYDTLAYTMVGE